MNRKSKDFILNSLSYLATFFSILILVSVLAFLVTKGLSSINMDLIVGDYNVVSENAKINNTNQTFIKPEDEKYYSSRYGVGFIDSETSNHKKIIEVSYVDPNSPLINMESLIAGEEGQTLSLKEGHSINNLYYLNESGQKRYLSFNMMKDAKTLTNILDNDTSSLVSIAYQTKGGGIRGSIVTTLYLIGLSLVFSLPIGILSAVYLNEYAKKNRLTNLLRNAIDTLTGIPSIIYGLMGVTVLYPITALVGATSTSILLGSLTLAVILLPIIIRNTEEALLVVPKSLRDASLSLGATKTQTIFKVVLPSAVSGILTGVLLSIGRVIGESAALVYTTSTIISDNPSLLSQGTSLSLMIYTIMGGEQPNLELASAISLIILITVFIINFTVKLIAKRYRAQFV